MEIRILRLFHWNDKDFLWTDLVSLKRENGERESNSGRMKESCDNSDDRWARVPLFPLAAAEWRVCTLTDAHSSAQSKMNVIAQYSETLPKTQPALRSHTRPLYSMGRQWNAQFGFVSLSCQVRVVFFTQVYLFFWCHMLNLVLHCKSLRFTLHVRGEERCSHLRAPSSFICPSMIPSLLSGDGCQAAQSLPEMGSFITHTRHSHGLHCIGADVLMVFVWEWMFLLYHYKMSMAFFTEIA